jgi:hypothetical protein
LRDFKFVDTGFVQRGLDHLELRFQNAGKDHLPHTSRRPRAGISDAITPAVRFAQTRIR